MEGFLPGRWQRGLLGAELTGRITATEAGVMLKEAWRAIFVFLASWLFADDTEPHGASAAVCNVFSTHGPEEHNAEPTDSTHSDSELVYVNSDSAFTPLFDFIYKNNQQNSIKI